MHNYEATEAHIEGHYRTKSRDRGMPLLMNGRQGGLDTHLMIASVTMYTSPSEIHRYEAHPDLDDVFFGLAYSYLLNRSTVDVFTLTCCWWSQVSALHPLSRIPAFISLKHERFCEALLAKASGDSTERYSPPLRPTRKFHRGHTDGADHYA